MRPISLQVKKEETKDLTNAEYKIKDKTEKTMNYEKEIEAIETKMDYLDEKIISEVNLEKMKVLQNKKDDLLNQLEKLYSEWIV